MFTSTRLQDSVHTREQTGGKQNIVKVHGFYCER